MHCLFSLKVYSKSGNFKLKFFLPFLVIVGRGFTLNNLRFLQKYFKNKFDRIMHKR